jgi:outer membrane protein assembly factor BamB
MIGTVGGKPQMLIAASEALQGVDPENGKVLWWAKCKGDIATPVTDGTLVYVDNARGGAGCCVDATGSGDVTATNVKWTYKTMVDGFNSPLIADGRLYRLFKQLKCIDVATGQEIYSETLGPGTPHASPILTPDGRIYYASAGTTYVIKTGPKFELLAKNELGDNSSASAAISDGLIILKGAKNLFCIGKK